MLKMFIYGLKQASKVCNQVFYDTIQITEERCLHKSCYGDAISFLILCMDDILIIGYDVGVLSSIKVYFTFLILASML